LRGRMGTGMISSHGDRGGDGDQSSGDGREISVPVQLSSAGCLDLDVFTVQKQSHGSVV